MGGHELPCKEGQKAEARSFGLGYRGAWFRCTIDDMRKKPHGIECALRYFDFPDEKVRWTKLYQKANNCKKKRQLILRPCFPPVYRESQLPDIKTISEVVVIVNDVWKVGDLVDWWFTEAYWTGTITEILGDEEYQVELLPPPLGEGLSYEASCKDIRPSLDWSPELGWTVPIPVGKENTHACARLIKPTNHGGSENLTAFGTDEGRTGCQATARASVMNITSFSSQISASSLPPLCRSEQAAKRPLSTSESKETQTLEINMESSKEAGNASGKDGHDDIGPSKKMRTDGSISLNSTCCDTIEAAILDLEELVNKVKWIKRILQYGLPVSNSVQPSWQVMEHRGPSMSK